ncbi:SCO2524 family protein [Streptomyces thinghirensis]|nr:SCO2524 family protein [Streptomyces thinghirensis]
MNVFDAESEQGKRLIQVVGQGRQSDRAVLQQFSRKLRPLRATIIESLSRGIEVDEGIRDESQLFECGWAWGVVQDAPEISDLSVLVPGQPAGIADRLPYVYFTVVALDGIQDLFSDRTLTLGLLDADQQKLAEALRLRWELSQQYWSAIARFGTERWPLEDLPWQTTGLRLESEYFSLTVAAILVHDLVRRKATDDDLTRTVAIMERLADRGRVTSRMTKDDPTIRLHNPGVTMPLAGSGALRRAPPVADDRLLGPAPQADHPARRTLPEHRRAGPAAAPRRAVLRAPVDPADRGRGRRGPLGQRPGRLPRRPRRRTAHVLEHHRARHRMPRRRPQPVRAAAHPQSRTRRAGQGTAQRGHPPVRQGAAGGLRATDGSRARAMRSIEEAASTTPAAPSTTGPPPPSPWPARAPGTRHPGPGQGAAAQEV